MKTLQFDRAALEHAGSRSAADLLRQQFETVLIRAAVLLAGRRKDIGGKPLHDFRVALRRLRSNLRARPGLFPGLRDSGWWKGFKKLSRLGGSIRDRELKIIALENNSEEAGRGKSKSLKALLARHDKQRIRQQRKFLRRLRRRLPKLARELQEALTNLPAGDNAPAAEDLRRLIAAHWRDAKDALSEVGNADDVAQPHRARIAVKRLRYLLEPLDARYPEARESVQLLTEIQDSLGGLHDSQLLGQSLDAEMDSGAIEAVKAQVGTQLTPRRRVAARSAGRAARRRLSRNLRHLIGRLDRVGSGAHRHF